MTRRTLALGAAASTMEPSAAATNLVDVTWLLGQLDHNTAALVRAQLPRSVAVDSQDTVSSSGLDGILTPLSSTNPGSFYAGFLTLSSTNVAGTPERTVDQDGGALIMSRGISEGRGHRRELIEAQRNNVKTHDQKICNKCGNDYDSHLCPSGPAALPGVLTGTRGATTTRTIGATAGTRTTRICGHWKPWVRLEGRCKCLDCRYTMPKFILLCEDCGVHLCVSCTHNFPWLFDPEERRL